jgi:hypothetical protein
MHSLSSLCVLNIAGVFPPGSLISGFAEGFCANTNSLHLIEEILMSETAITAPAQVFDDVVNKMDDQSNLNASNQ